MSDKVSDSPLAPAEEFELEVPGWSGYKERDLIRQDDVLVRNFIRDFLLKIEEKVRGSEATIAQENPFDVSLSKYETLLAKLRQLIDEITSAPAGMLSYYARYKFTEEDQQALVDFDLKLLVLVKKIMAIISSQGSIDIATITTDVEQMHDQFFERNKIFVSPKLQQKEEE